jgi:hypothetical protein
MERTPLGGGRFLITHTPEEIEQINRSIEISYQIALTALAVTRKESATDPAEIQDLSNDIKRHIEIVDRLMSEPIISEHETSNDPISEEERQIGGVVHAVMDENLSFGLAGKMIEAIREQNTSVDPKTAILSDPKVFTVSTKPPVVPKDIDEEVITPKADSQTESYS